MDLPASRHANMRPQRTTDDSPAIPRLDMQKLSLHNHTPSSSSSSYAALPYTSRNASGWSAVADPRSALITHRPNQSSLSSHSPVLLPNRVNSNNSSNNSNRNNTMNNNTSMNNNITSGYPPSWQRSPTDIGLGQDSNRSSNTPTSNLSRQHSLMNNNNNNNNSTPRPSALRPTVSQGMTVRHKRNTSNPLNNPVMSHNGDGNIGIEQKATPSASINGDIIPGYTTHEGLKVFNLSHKFKPNLDADNDKNELDNSEDEPVYNPLSTSSTLMMTSLNAIRQNSKNNINSVKLKDRSESTLLSSIYGVSLRQRILLLSYSYLQRQNIQDNFFHVYSSDILKHQECFSSASGSSHGSVGQDSGSLVNIPLLSWLFFQQHDLEVLKQMEKQNNAAIVSDNNAVTPNTRRPSPRHRNQHTKTHTSRGNKPDVSRGGDGSVASGTTRNDVNVFINQPSLYFDDNDPQPTRTNGSRNRDRQNNEYNNVPELLSELIKTPESNDMISLSRLKDMFCTLISSHPAVYAMKNQKPIPKQFQHVHIPELHSDNGNTSSNINDHDHNKPTNKNNNNSNNTNTGGNANANVNSIASGNQCPSIPPPVLTSVIDELSSIATAYIYHNIKQQRALNDATATVSTNTRCNDLDDQPRSHRRRSSVIDTGGLIKGLENSNTDMSDYEDGQGWSLLMYDLKEHESSSKSKQKTNAGKFMNNNPTVIEGITWLEWQSEVMKWIGNEEVYSSNNNNSNTTSHDHGHDNNNNMNINYNKNLTNDESCDTCASLLDPTPPLHHDINTNTCIYKYTQLYLLALLKNHHCIRIIRQGLQLRLSSLIYVLSLPIYMRKKFPITLSHLVSLLSRTDLAIEYSLNPSHLYLISLMTNAQLAEPQQVIATLGSSSTYNYILTGNAKVSLHTGVVDRYMVFQPLYIAQDNNINTNITTVNSSHNGSLNNSHLQSTSQSSSTSSLHLNAVQTKQGRSKQLNNKRLHNSHTELAWEEDDAIDNFITNMCLTYNQKMERKERERESKRRRNTTSGDEDTVGVGALSTDDVENKPADAFESLDMSVDGIEGDEGVEGMCGDYANTNNTPTPTRPKSTDPLKASTNTTENILPPNNATSRDYNHDLNNPKSKSGKGSSAHGLNPNSHFHRNVNLTMSGLQRLQHDINIAETRVLGNGGEDVSKAVGIRTNSDKHSKSTNSFHGNDDINDEIYNTIYNVSSTETYYPILEELQATTIMSLTTISSSNTFGLYSLLCHNKHVYHITATEPTVYISIDYDMFKSTIFHHIQAIVQRKHALLRQIPQMSLLSNENIMYFAIISRIRITNEKDVLLTQQGQHCRNNQPYTWSRCSCNLYCTCRQGNNNNNYNYNNNSNISNNNNNVSSISRVPIPIVSTQSCPYPLDPPVSFTVYNDQSTTNKTNVGEDWPDACASVDDECETGESSTSSMSASKSTSSTYSHVHPSMSVLPVQHHLYCLDTAGIDYHTSRDNMHCHNTYNTNDATAGHIDPNHPHTSSVIPSTYEEHNEGVSLQRVASFVDSLAMRVMVGTHTLHTNNNASPSVSSSPLSALLSMDWPRLSPHSALHSSVFFSIKGELKVIQELAYHKQNPITNMSGSHGMLSSFIELEPISEYTLFGADAIIPYILPHVINFWNGDNLNTKNQNPQLSDLSGGRNPLDLSQLYMFRQFNAKNKHKSDNTLTVNTDDKHALNNRTYMNNNTSVDNIHNMPNSRVNTSVEASPNSSIDVGSNDSFTNNQHTNNGSNTSLISAHRRRNSIPMINPLLTMLTNETNADVSFDAENSVNNIFNNVTDANRSDNYLSSNSYINANSNINANNTIQVNIDADEEIANPETHLMNAQYFKMFKTSLLYDMVRHFGTRTSSVVTNDVGHSNTNKSQHNNSNASNNLDRVVVPPTLQVGNVLFLVSSEDWAFFAPPILSQSLVYSALDQPRSSSYTHAFIEDQRWSQYKQSISNTVIMNGLYSQLRNNVNNHGEEDIMKMLAKAASSSRGLTSLDDNNTNGSNNKEVATKIYPLLNPLQRQQLKTASQYLPHYVIPAAQGIREIEHLKHCKNTSKLPLYNSHQPYIPVYTQNRKGSGRYPGQSSNNDDTSKGNDDRFRRSNTLTDLATSSFSGTSSISSSYGFTKTGSGKKVHIRDLPTNMPASEKLMMYINSRLDDDYHDLVILDNSVPYY